MKHLFRLSLFVLAAVSAQAVSQTAASSGTGPGSLPMSGVANVVTMSWGGSGWGAVMTYKYTGTVNASAGASASVTSMGGGGTGINGGFTTSTSFVTVTSGANALAPNTMYKLISSVEWQGAGVVATSFTTFTTPPAPPVTKSAMIPLTNNSEYEEKVEFQDSVTGKTYNTIILKPGEKVYTTLKSPSGGDALTFYTWKDVTVSGGVATGHPGLNTGPIQGDTIPSYMFTDDSPSPTYIPPMMPDPFPVSNPTAAPFAPGGNAAPGGGATVSKPIFDSTALASSTAATNGVIAQGFENSTREITKAIFDSAKKYQTTVVSGGGGGGDATAANQVAGNGKLDTLHGDLTDATGFSYTAPSVDPYDTVTYIPAHTDIDPVLDLVPASPAATILPTSITPTSHFTFSIRTPAWRNATQQDYSVDADLSPWATEVAALRGVMLAALSIGLYLLVGQLVRKTFAS